MGMSKLYARLGNHRYVLCEVYKKFSGAIKRERSLMNGGKIRIDFQALHRWFSLHPNFTSTISSDEIRLGNRWGEQIAINDFSSLETL